MQVSLYLYISMSLLIYYHTLLLVLELAAAFPSGERSFVGFQEV